MISIEIKSITIVLSFVMDNIFKFVKLSEPNLNEVVCTKRLRVPKVRSCYVLSKTRKSVVSVSIYTPSNPCYNQLKRTPIATNPKFVRHSFKFFEI